MEAVRVAGGILWRRGREGPRLVLVHRRGRGDWGLPKGRVDAGEAWHEAALREVAEETGCAARISRFAGAKLLLARALPKLVLYWHMALVDEGDPDGDEVDEVAWLSPRPALSRLDHGSDRRLLLRALSGGDWRADDDGRPLRPVPSADGGVLRQALLLDVRRPENEIAPFLRLVERAVAAEGRSASSGARSLRR
ncbi:MAG TPA: NUDIX domain-containing protein [Anaeromyxobacter sp.]|nr:NUDIX domain-containing protein [Anaeromyxobacter sp.]